ncbi:hypothetical protein [Galbibacter pacificus]|uniref:PepSY domain-containing protein n=1 Tax=Galbibacter pacificus TaxID=2996052 RepID=A0ABT6FMF1_9FLAO|nr:hypothetical protein [Galbibacter pacificus]MDG3580966.1 hypothetical protein [Galbibacter pacificus]MDG3584444.1 hypothetical protein [Galbibacter pacificus]
MKKIVLVVAMALGSLTAFAATPAVANNDTKVATLQDDYKEIAVAEVPQAVQEALQADYPEAQITKAYVNEENTYKIEVQMGEQTGTLFANENGEWIEQ